MDMNFLNFNNIEIQEIHSPKNHIKVDMKKKAKIKYRRMWYQTIKSRKRDWGLIVYLGVLSYSRAQRLLICSETAKASTLHVRGINLAFYWAFDAKPSENYSPKAEKSYQ